MTKQDGFSFIPQKWLGDSTIMAMDWDCRGMHLHLMAIAWQQEKQGYILEDINIIRKILGNPDLEDWNNRIKPQLFSAWKKKVVKENGTEKTYLYQPGLLKTLEATGVVVKKTRTKKSIDISDDFADVDFQGFNLKAILKEKPAKTILYIQPIAATTEEKTTIWSLGVQLLQQYGDTEQKARGFLSRLIKLYGDKQVSLAIAQLSLKNTNPADMHSYLVGMLKKQEEEAPTKKSGRGHVSL